MGILDGLRQWMFPAEFRIGRPVWPQQWRESLEKLAQPPVAPRHHEDPEALKERLRLLADLGTGLWRLRQKMVEPGTDHPREEMSRAYRHFESVWDALAEAGVEIIDHTGSPIVDGMTLKAVAFQPTPGLTRDKVIETIKPTVYYQDNPIQIGEVIVGTPEQPQEESEQAGGGKPQEGTSKDGDVARAEGTEPEQGE